MPDRPAATLTPEHDGRLVRRVRWQLIAWSAGSTLVVLLVLGAALYAAVATTLGSASESLLRERAALLASSTTIESTGTVSVGAGTGPVTAGGAAGLTVVTSTQAGQPGFAVDGRYAGTLAIVLPELASTPGVMTGSGQSNGTGAGVGAMGGPTGAPPPDATGIPDPGGYSAALHGATTISELTWQGSPVRVLSVPLGSGVVQVVGDRTAELRTLGVLLMVLLVGGVAAMAVAAGFGWLYASRALVPIRAALRRQREFAADTSHELRTPLAVMRASVARLRQQPDARVADVEPALVAVDAEAVRLAALVDDLLALARTDAGQVDLDLRPVDLAEIATDAVAALEPLAASRRVSLALDLEPAPLDGDEGRLRRLVTVLVDNGIRHGREGGRVAVTVRPGRLTVDDDGPGIPPGDRRRIFERFWRGASAGSAGSGLGLAIAAWIVDRHAGRIEAGESRLGGARLDVILPRFTTAS